jgi:hypothetical protein
MLSIVLQHTFAAASSVGERDSCGISAACAGLCAIPAMLISAARLSTSANGPSAATTAASAAPSAARARPPATSTRRREWWSASIAP